ncbi:MAG: hypothetical protein J6L87_08450 [Clostridia bacterium]|nr:hypothetical protein [Clostridia bacterium]
MMLYAAEKELTGCVDARKEPTPGGVVLLDATGRILAGRVPGLTCRRGWPLERLLSLPSAEAAALELHVQRRAKEALLLQSRETPFIFWNGGGAAGGRALVIVPPEEIRPALMALPDYLDQGPSWLRLTTYSATMLTQPREALYRPLVRWLTNIQHLFTPLSPEGNAGEVLRLVHRRVTRLAGLCGVRLEYELGGIGLFPLPDADPDALVLQLAAVLLLARRAATERSALLLADREGPDAPVAHVVLHLRRETDDFPELKGLAEDAELRGNLFLAGRAPEEPSLLHIRFTFSRKELSLQEMRNHFDWIG